MRSRMNTRIVITSYSIHYTKLYDSDNSRMLTATAWFPEQPLMSEMIGRKTASTITAPSTSWYWAITLAAMTFKNMLTDRNNFV